MRNDPTRGRRLKQQLPYPYDQDLSKVLRGLKRRNPITRRSRQAEEMFTVLDGEVRVTFRGETIVARAGQTINVPANAPHAFTNAGEAPVRLLCLCAPAGQDEFFTLVGQPVATRTEPPPPLDAEAQAAFIAKSMKLAPQYKTELLPPPSHG